MSQAVFVARTAHKSHRAIPSSQDQFVADLHTIASGPFTPPRTADGAVLHDVLPGGEAFKAGRLHRATAFWDRVLQEPTVSETHRDLVWRTVHEGADVLMFYDAPPPGTVVPGQVAPAVPASSDPIASRFPAVRLPNHPLAPAQNPALGCPATFLREQVAVMERTGAVERCPPGVTPRLVLPLGVAENSTKLRVVYDARVLNLFQAPGDMGYPSLRDLSPWVTPDALLICADLMSAYYHVRLTDRSRTCFGFELDGVMYWYTSIPFGWSCAPFLFQLLISLFAGFLRRHGLILLIAYLDDLIGCGTARPFGRSAVEDALISGWTISRAAFLAGFTLSVPKCELQGTPERRALGLIVSAPRQCFLVPADKARRFKDAASALAAAPSAPVRTLQQFAGWLVSLLPAVPAALVYLRDVFSWVSTALQGGHADVPLGPSRAHVFRLFESDRVLDSPRPWVGESHVHVQALATDSSRTGMGLCLTTATGPVPLRFTAALPIPRRLRHADIMALEAQAVLEGLLMFADQLRGSRVRLLVDNEVVRVALQMRGSRHLPTNRIVQRVLALALELNMILTVDRITTTDNVHADTESRKPARAQDGRVRVHRATASDLAIGPEYAAPVAPERLAHGVTGLHPRLFLRVQEWYGHPFSLDLAACSQSRQVSRYVGLTREPVQDQVAVDLFSFQPDATERVYVNPPWHIIGSVWKHLQHVGARGVLIFPCKPSAVWYSAVMRQALEVAELAPLGAANAFRDWRRGGAAVETPLSTALLMAAFDFRCLLA